jgi:hypothetical protein
MGVRMATGSGRELKKNSATGVCTSLRFWLGVIVSGFVCGAWDTDDHKR